MNPSISTTNESDPPIHAIGNGNLMIYGQGPDIRHVFGPPYTSCDQLAMTIDKEWTWRSERRPGATNWSHKGLSKEGGNQALVRDVVHPVWPLWARKFETAQPGFSIRCVFPAYTEIAEQSAGPFAGPERYIGKRHDGCRARPWESAVNLTALIRAANAIASQEAERY